MTNEKHKATRAARNSARTTSEPSRLSITSADQTLAVPPSSASSTKMFPSITAFVAILATLSAAQTALPSCTKTLTPEGVTCCPPVAGHTATSYIDCNGCALTSAQGPLCKMKCSVPFPTSTDLTTTLTSCAPSITPSMSTYVKRDDPIITINDPIETCTITAFTKTVGGCGDCGIKYESTKTKSIECAGCALLTTETTIEGAMVCACPTDKETTVTACKTG